MMGVILTCLLSSGRRRRRKLAKLNRQLQTLKMIVQRAIQSVRNQLANR